MIAAGLPRLPKRPLVYLDHWALMGFAEQSQMRARLVDGLRAASGSLCLTAISLAEICRVDDPRHAHHIDSLLQELQGNVFAIHLADLLSGQAPYAAGRTHLPYDHELGFELTRPREFCIPGPFGRTWQARSRGAAAFNEMAVNVAAAFDRMRAVDEYREKALTAKPDRVAPWVYVVSGELMRAAVLNVKEKISPNDAADLQHALVALMCCDLSLLDKKFAARAESARSRLRDRGEQLGRCYSSKGIETFLDALTSWRSLKAKSF